METGAVMARTRITPRPKKGEAEQKEASPERQQAQVEDDKDKTLSESKKRETRSATKVVETDEMDVSDQEEGGKKITYSFSPREIIDVEDDSLDTPRIQIARKIKAMYGASYEVSIGTAEFLRFIIEDDADNLADLDEADKYLNHFGPLTIISLYYL